MRILTTIILVAAVLLTGCSRKEDKKGYGFVERKGAGFWKCPYHNSRLCLETIERFK